MGIAAKVREELVGAGVTRGVTLRECENECGAVLRLTVDDPRVNAQTVRRIGSKYETVRMEPDGTIVIDADGENQFVHVELSRRAADAYVYRYENFVKEAWEYLARPGDVAPIGGTEQELYLTVAQDGRTFLILDQRGKRVGSADRLSMAALEVALIDMDHRDQLSAAGPPFRKAA